MDVAKQVSPRGKPGKRAPPPQAAGRYLISVIGINKYRHHDKLVNAVNDADGIAHVFQEKLGFECIARLVDSKATKAAIEKLIQDDLPRSLKETDNFVLFFAGHGRTRKSKVGGSEIETGYLVPVEATKSEWGRCIKLGDFLESLSRLPARHVLVILDSCFSSAAEDAVKRLTRSGDNSVSAQFDESSWMEDDPQSTEQLRQMAHEFAAEVSRKVITSGRRHQLAQDASRTGAKHSLFSEFLIGLLESGDKFNLKLDKRRIVMGTKLCEQLKEPVRLAPGSKQTPGVYPFTLDEDGEMVMWLTNTWADRLEIQAKMIKSMPAIATPSMSPPASLMRPDIRQWLADPQFRQQLLSDPEFQKQLMADPQLKPLREKVARAMMQQLQLAQQVQEQVQPIR